MVTSNNILNKLLLNHKNITTEDIVEIKQIIQKYPYFQPAYLLQTIFLKKSGSFYKNILQETAARTNDRERLYEIIELEEKQTIQNKILTKTNSEKKEKTTSSKTKKSNISSNIIENKTIKPIKNNFQKEIIDKKNNINTSKDQKIKNSTNKQSLQINKKEKLSYLEWLQKVNIKKKHENSQFFETIENFLKDKPKIIPQKEKSIEPLAIIEKSIEEKQTLMTETLANLYIKQKKYAKAIQAFKILSLKYPKKSSYFANQIKELKQKLK